MKPFNVEAAVRGEPIVTRDGRYVRFGGYNPDAAEPTEAVVGWLGGYLRSWDKDGRYYGSSQTAPCDLFMTTKTVELWVVMYDCGYNYLKPGLVFYNTKEEAEKDSHGKPVAQITWEE